MVGCSCGRDGLLPPSLISPTHLPALRATPGIYISQQFLHWISLKLTNLGFLVVSRFLPHKNPTFVKDGNIDILCRYSVL